MDDREIIDRLRAGDATALLARYGTPVFTLVRRIVGCEADAEEITEDVFLKVYDNVQKWRSDCAFSTWIYRIAYNTSISALRRRRKVIVDRGFVELERVPDTVTDYDHHREAQYVALEKAIAELSADDRALINLYYYDNHSVEYLSEVSGLSVSNVKVKLFRIRKKLHEKLKN